MRIIINIKDMSSMEFVERFRSGQRVQPQIDSITIEGFGGNHLSAACDIVDTIDQLFLGKPMYILGLIRSIDGIEPCMDGFADAMAHQQTQSRVGAGNDDRQPD